jgi:hypothetical protein
MAGLRNPERYARDTLRTTRHARIRTHPHALTAWTDGAARLRQTPHNILSRNRAPSLFQRSLGMLVQISPASDASGVRTHAAIRSVAPPSSG